MRDKAPNFLFITSDEHRADALGCAGNASIQTPHLDALASEGVRFERLYCQGPLCQPARASLLTGRHVAEHGLLWNGPEIPASWTTMPRSLQERGYETAIVGKTHFLADPQFSNPSLRRRQERHIQALGFDHVSEEFDKYVHAREGVLTPYMQYLEERGLLQPYLDQVHRLRFPGPHVWDGETSVVPREHDLTTFVLEEALAWLGARSQERPFFLWLSFVPPHPPFVDDPDWAAVYADAEVPAPVAPPIETPENPWGHYLRELGRYKLLMRMPDSAVANTRRHYYGQISLIDEAVGRLLQVLDETGLASNTWVIYTSDHGEMLGDHGVWTKGIFHLPSVLVPGIIRPPGGAATARVVTEPVESVDLTATMLDLAGAPVPVCGRSLTPQLVDGKPLSPSAVASELSFFGHHLLAVATERYRYTYDRATDWPCELFDLVEDPAERHNLVDDPGKRGIRDDLHADYIAPRLKHPVHDGVVRELGDICHSPR